MTPRVERIGNVALYLGDCREVLATLPDASVHCVVTSPPYFGLRDYGTAQWDGGDAECGHTRPVSFKSSTLGASTGGLEASPDEFIAQMVAVFREVRRVLRPDGVMFLNLGDSYCSTDKWGGGVGGNTGKHTVADDGSVPSWSVRQRKAPMDGIKPKDLLMMPARVALALQQDGWFLRSQMPWIKRSCMPESTTDRPTSAIEYVYLLTKSPRYFWDGEAVKRSAADTTGPRLVQNVGAQAGSSRANGGGKTNGPMRAVGGSSRNFRNSDLFFDSLEAPHGAITDANGDMLALDVNPAGFADAHFATFPARLIEPLIRAGTSERGCCPACGKQWGRVTERSGGTYEARKAMGVGGPYNGKPEEYQTCGSSVATTTGWAASCTCDAGAPVPATVLDPFSGAGTTALVADRLGRRAIGIELNPDYVVMSVERIRRDAGMFAEVTHIAPPAAPAAQLDLLAGAA